MMKSCKVQPAQLIEMQTPTCAESESFRPWALWSSHNISQLPRNHPIQSVSPGRPPRRAAATRRDASPTRDKRPCSGRRVQRASGAAEPCSRARRRACAPQERASSRSASRSAAQRSRSAAKARMSVSYAALAAALLPPILLPFLSVRFFLSESTNAENYHRKDRR